VTFVARGRHLAAIKENGLRVQSPLGDVTLNDSQVVESVDAIGDADLVMLAVKLWDTEDAARSLVPLVKRGAAVVSFQNGVQKDDTLAQYLPKAAIIGGVC
jgi:2-dehydropantoate 2-reductase